MSLTVIAEAPPLAPDSQGVIRVAGTQITLDSLIACYQQGETPEELALNFPPLQLADVYAAIGYYHRHRAEVEACLSARDERRGQVRREVGMWSPQAPLLARLRARKQA
jgi:uncharacterized protein (DUF433 family)